MNKNTKNRLPKILAALPAAALLVAVFGGSMLQPQQAFSDDRDLLGTSGDKPYVFFIIDSSSSMRRFVGNEWVPGANDDPNSKIYQAKKAVYEVIDLVGENALFGFAIFDISTANPVDRHWLYTPQDNPSWFSSEPDFSGGSATAPWLGPGTSEVAYPRPGHPLLFGDANSQDDQDPAQIDNDNTDGSCQYPENLDVEVATPVEGLGGAADDRNANKKNWTDTRGLGQMWSFAKLGRNGDTETVQWFKLNNKKYRLTWKALTGGQQMGDVPLNVQVDLQRLNNANCTSPAFDDIAIDETLVMVPLHTEDLDGDPFTTGLAEIISEQSKSRGFFSEKDYTPGGACDGDELYLETNYDADDVGQQYSYDFIPDPLGRDPVDNTLDRGDLVPLDWTNPGYVVGNRQEILRRLAPSILLGEEPDFRIARYFKSYDELVDGQLVLKDEFIDYPPIITGANTPLGGSLFRFRQWYDDWVNVAIAQDPDWDCRGGVHIILLTDGNESCQGDYPPPDSSVAEFCPEGGSAPGGCGGSPTALCSCESNGNEIPAYQAYVLNQGETSMIVVPDDPDTPEIETEYGNVARDVKTYVIGYDNSQASLDYTARAGGTCSDRDNNPATPDECAYFPTNKDELVEDLLDILDVIRAEPRAFVPAATPPRTFNADEKIVLSNFVPIAGESTWDGHMGAFLKPLPLTSEGRPDTSVVCNGTTITESCFLWDVGAELEEQAPTESEVASTPPLLDIGPAAEERRVFYGKEQSISTPDAVPLPRRLFAFNNSTTAAEWTDLLTGLGLDVIEVDRGKDVIRNTLKIKQATIPDPNDTTIDVEIQYVLGDIFHSDPAVLGIPNEGRFFGVDLFSTDPFDCTDNPGYRCYFEKHQFRRQVLAAGANDGQVHFFDLARFEYTTDPEEDGEYNNGTGRELFSYIPRGVLPNVLVQAEGDTHDWDVDSPVRVADVFIDPVHTGIPTADEREWRTVLMGGLRRGGSLYYALDMTQPDKLDTKNVGLPLNGYVPSCWNGGSAEDCGPVPYGAALWEFTDAWDEDSASESGHGHADLGDTWSVPNTGMIRVLEWDGAENVEVIKFVAVFGGGLDPANQGNLGNWLYMVDIETGKTIYKRRLSSSAASEPAAVDTDQNGFIDTIYIGTTDGYLYKADVGEPKLLNPAAIVTDYSTGVAVDRTVNRVMDTAWDPFKVFDTGGRPIYFPPSVIFVAKLGQYALSFGTGDREEILALNNQVARFYTFVDDGFHVNDVRLPLDENDLTVIEFDSVLAQSQDLLVNPPTGFEAGWVLTLTANEKVITKSLAFAGILTFSSFSPDASQTDSCGGTGAGKIFIVNTTNANAIKAIDSSDTRYFDVSDIVTNPYVEPGGMPGDDDDDDDSGNPCAGQLLMTQKLMQLFPSGCKFSNRTENIMTQRADTGVQCIAPVPICVDPKNWKEY